MCVDSIYGRHAQTFLGVPWRVGVEPALHSRQEPAFIISQGTIYHAMMKVRGATAQPPQPAASIFIHHHTCGGKEHFSKSF